MANELKLPPLDQALIEALDRMYPERCPDPSWNEREIWIRVGERRVVRRLQEELRRLGPRMRSWRHLDALAVLFSAILRLMLLCNVVMTPEITEPPRMFTAPNKYRER